jgi:hypothetical protein
MLFELIEGAAPTVSVIVPRLNAWKLLVSEMNFRCCTGWDKFNGYQAGTSGKLGITLPSSCINQFCGRRDFAILSTHLDRTQPLGG